MSQSSTPSDLPPQIPGTPGGLQRAICLLGNRTKSDLNPKSRQELIQLLGTYPNVKQAQQWKQSLKQVTKGRS
ncbi:MAG: hypothetical protein ACLFQP_10720 [Halothece sp.]